LRDLNIFCTTTANQRAILEQLKQMAMQNNTTGASIYDLGKIVQADSIAEVNTALKSSDQKQQEAKQQEAQSAQQLQQEQLASAEKQKQMEIQAAAERDDKMIQKDITVAEIRSAGYGAMQDINKNQMSDYADAMKDIKETEQYQSQMQLQREKQTNENYRENQKIDIDRQKLQVQREIADKQLQIARENKNKFDKPNKDEKKK
jgi:murein DD-endopeptidase MepM/ murein hydrolase activator NlpD